MAAALRNRLAQQAAGQTQLDFDPLGRDEPKLVSLPCRLIDPDPDQPRRNLGNLEELADSIRTQGLIHPVVVEPRSLGRYRVLAGARRFAACVELGLETVPCIVRSVDDQSRLALQLIENLHRKDLHPVEEARAFRRLMDEFNLTQRELAERLGKSLPAVNQTLRVLDLDQTVLADVQTSEQASKSLLLEIAKEPDSARQKALWERAQAGELTVRSARSAKHPPKPKGMAPATHTVLVDGATVVVRFQAGPATPERVKAALEQALACSCAPA